MAHTGFNSTSSDLESKSMIKRHVEKFRRRVWLQRVCYVVIFLAITAIVAHVGFRPDQIAPSNRSVLSSPSSMIPYYWQRERKNGEIHIEGVLSFDSEVLVMIRVPESPSFPSKETIQCRYGFVTPFAHHKAMAVHLYQNRAAVLCAPPPENHTWNASSVAILIDQGNEIQATIAAPRQPFQWNATKVAYEAFPTEADMVVFVHGINHTRGAHLPAIPDYERLNQFQCVYNGWFKTDTTAQSQEIFRCPHPPASLIPILTGKKLTVQFEGTILPSVAYYNPQTRAPPGPKRHHICACTMIYNGAKFVKEWVYYHSHLGVAKFFLYDNNSDDNLEEVVASLGSFNVTKQPWPWVKTQEAGFSHCSLIAQPECTWMLFTDVDEYFFPNSPSTFQPTSSSILATFITQVTTEANSKVGEISTFCYNFGPSGLTDSPPQGVTQGYTCREKKPERHKSIVLLSAIDFSLENVIHHFRLRVGYERKLVRPGVAVINHYKFQVWDEFKRKFRRRAAAYVVDWTEDRNRDSKDRVVGLGTKAVKPRDWESRYCEVRDYGLRNYTRRIFGYGGEGSLRLPWE